MEDDILESLFAGFKPELSSDIEFMNKLKKNLTTIDLIRQNIAVTRLRNKQAVVIGLVVGFIVGFLFSMLLPYLKDIVSNWQSMLPNEPLLNIFVNNFSVIACIVIGTTSVLAALNTYEVSLFLMKKRKIY